MLRAEAFKHYIDGFNAADDETIVNLIPNAGAWDWMSGNVPLFECPDETIQRTYYYRWWTFRKHIKQTPAGIIVTEFIEPVRHAGTYNSISCALGHHIAEGRWIRDGRILDEYTRFWFRGGENGGPEYRFHRYSQWTAAAMIDRYRVSGDEKLLIDLLPDLIADYAKWEEKKRRDDGLFWQFDVWDGMEESISGSRKHRNARPTINSYMYGNALAIAEIATTAGKTAVADNFRAKAATLKRLVRRSCGTPRRDSSRPRPRKAPCRTRARRSASFPGASTCPSPAADTRRRGSNSSTSRASGRPPASRPPNVATEVFARTAWENANGTAPSGRSRPRRRSTRLPTCCGNMISRTSRSGITSTRCGRTRNRTRRTASRISASTTMKSPASGSRVTTRAAGTTTIRRSVTSS